MSGPLETGPERSMHCETCNSDFVDQETFDAHLVIGSECRQALRRKRQRGRGDRVSLRPGSGRGEEMGFEDAGAMSPDSKERARRRPRWADEAASEEKMGAWLLGAGTPAPVSRRCA